MRERVARLEQAITEAVKLASPELQQVINDLQALRGIVDISAVTIAAELGHVAIWVKGQHLAPFNTLATVGRKCGPRKALIIPVPNEQEIVVHKFLQQFAALSGFRDMMSEY